MLEVVVVELVQEVQVPLLQFQLEVQVEEVQVVMDVLHSHLL
jgi:hypothetical protein